MEGLVTSALVLESGYVRKPAIQGTHPRNTNRLWAQLNARSLLSEVRVQCAIEKPNSSAALK